ncbi:GNAT family N-acetyltransferase [bacterium]|nr:GNAT family N-acetyltransferase [bacterium]
MLKQQKTTQLRPFTLDDAEAAVDLFNAHAIQMIGSADTSLDEMMVEWTTPGFDLDKHVRVLEDQDGTIIGYIDVWDVSKPHVTKYAFGLLHPDAWDDQVFYDMLAWAEECARKRIDLAPENARVILNFGLNNRSIRRKTVMESYGYELVRHFYRMVIDLDKTLPAPKVPEGITIAPIRLDEELEDAVRALDDGFADHWGHVHRSLEESLKQWKHIIETSDDFDPTLWYLAKDGNEIAGVCACSQKVTEDPDMGWVNQLCVLRPWRRRGLGLALLQTAFNEFHRRGKQRVGLGVDASSLTNATRLYEKAGMHVVRQYDTYQFELRPGEDLHKTQA